MQINFMDDWLYVFVTWHHKMMNKGPLEKLIKEPKSI